MMTDNRPTVDEAIARWESKGPTSLTIALMAEALYRVRDGVVDGTHGRNHARLPDGVLLDPGYCDGCDKKRGGETC